MQVEMIHVLLNFYRKLITVKCDHGHTPTPTPTYKHIYIHTYIHLNLLQHTASVTPTAIIIEKTTTSHHCKEINISYRKLHYKFNN